MRDAVMEHRDNTGIADQDFICAACRRIAEKRGPDIGVDQFSDRAEFTDEEADDHRRLAGIERLR